VAVARPRSDRRAGLATTLGKTRPPRLAAVVVPACPIRATRSRCRKEGRRFEKYWTEVCCELEAQYLVVRGALRTYRVHLGSGLWPTAFAVADGTRVA
jgi:hypothetical protein